MALLWRHLLIPLVINLCANSDLVRAISKSASKQLMNVLTTVASANGILPDNIMSLIESTAYVDVNKPASQLLRLPYFTQFSDSQDVSSCSNTNFVPKSPTSEQISPYDPQVLPNILCCPNNVLKNQVQNQLTQLNSPALAPNNLQQYKNQLQQALPPYQASTHLRTIPALLQNVGFSWQDVQPTEPPLSCPHLIALTPTSSLKTVSVSEYDKPLSIEVSLSPSVDILAPMSSSTSAVLQSDWMSPIILVPPPVAPPRSSSNSLLPLLLLSLLSDDSGFGNFGGGGGGCCNCGRGSCGCCYGRFCSSNGYRGGNCCGGNNCGCDDCSTNSYSEELCDDSDYTEPLYPVYDPDDDVDPFENGPLYDEDGCYYYIRC